MVSCVITAAGESERMGEQKALLDFDGTPALGLVLQAVKRAGVDRTILVLGHEAATVRRAVKEAANGVRIVDYHNYRRGKTSSLKFGLSEVRGDENSVLYFPADHPLVMDSDLKLLLKAWRGRTDDRKKIFIPVHGGHRGHPILFSTELVKEVLLLGDDEPLKDWVHRHEADVELVEAKKPWVLMNMNTPEDYKKCLDAYRSRM